jgi:hypothetical protein
MAYGVRLENFIHILKMHSSSQQHTEAVYKAWKKNETSNKNAEEQIQYRAHLGR